MRRTVIGAAMLLGFGLASASQAAKPLPATPKTNPGTWITPESYPLDALQAGAQGRTAFTLTVDPTGSVSNCTVTATSGSTSLDNATCVLMRGIARFSPALDKRGRPIVGSFSSSVMWRLPDAADPTKQGARGAPYKPR